MNFYSNTKIINSFNATFFAGEISKNIRIPVMCDNVLEGTERFNISLRLTSNNPQVRIGRDRAVGIIMDSTGNDVMKQ